MRHEVEHRHIARVTDAGEDRQFELRTDSTERVFVETGEVGSGSAATNDSDAIKRRAYLH